MSAESIARWAGMASLVAASLIVISQLVLLAAGLLGAAPTSVIYTLKYALAFVALFVLLLALVGLYVQQARESGTLGRVSFLIAFFGTMLVAGDWWYEAFVTPQISLVAPEVFTGPIAGSLLVGAILTLGSFALGWLLFGIASYRARVFPRGSALLLAIGGVVGLLALTPPFQIPIALAVGWMGWWLRRRPERTEDQLDG